MTMKLTLILLICGCFLFSNMVTALFEDQVGKFDWMIENTGNVTWSRFVTVNNVNSLLVSSDTTLALKDLKTGAFTWRKVFGDQDGQISSVAVVENAAYVATFHLGRSLCRLFDSSNGNLRYEISLVPESTAAEVITDYVINPKQSTNVFVVSKTSVRSVNLDDGLNWNYPLNIDDVDAFYDRRVFLDQTVRVVTLYKTGIHVLQFESQSGEKLLDSRSSFDFSFEQCQLFRSHVLCWKNDMLSYFSLDQMSKSEGQKIQFKTSKLGFKILDVEFVKNSLYLLKFEDRAATLVDISVKEVSTIQHFEHFLTSAAIQSQFSSADRYFAFVHSNNNVITVTSVNCESKKQHVVASLDSVSKQLMSHGKLLHLSLFMEKLSGDAFDNMYVAMEDLETFLIQRTKKGYGVLWRKDESLAYVVDVEMSDLNLSEMMVTLEADFEFTNNPKTTLVEMFYRRFSSHFHQFMHFAESTYEQLQSGALFKECSAKNSPLDLVRDKFNVNKMAVVVTENGKLIGMLSSSGQIVWSNWLREISFKKSLAQSEVFLFLQRGTDDYKFKPKAVLVGQNSQSGNAAIVYFDPLTGEILEHLKDTGYKASQVFSISELVNSENLKLFAILKDDLTLKLFPEDKHSHQLFTDFCKENTFVVLAHKGDAFFGLQFKSAGNGKIVWQHNFGPDHRVHGIHIKREGELVDSPGRVQADQTVLFKYLNPNLAFIVLEPKLQDVSPESTSSADSKYQYEFSLVDVISGETVFATTMRRVSDIKVVHSENWAVLSVWNEKNRRTELTVIELYESANDSERNGTHFSAFSNTSAPMVLRQSYIYAGFVRSMATTCSEKGLTNKQVILGTASGALIPIPKGVLDPRRTLNSRAPREEGVMPYHPLISLPLELTINYNRSIASIRNSRAFPAGLESTVLLFTYGLDLFFTQTFPSEMFDVLSADFEFWIIGGVCSALFVASFVTKKLSAYYALKKAWK